MKAIAVILAALLSVAAIYAQGGTRVRVIRENELGKYDTTYVTATYVRRDSRGWYLNLLGDDEEWCDAPKCRIEECGSK